MSAFANSQGTTYVTARYDEAWDDPLPHALSPRKEYLRQSLGITGTDKPRAVVIFMHGRGDNADDMVGVFLPVLAQRFGGHEGGVDSADEQSANLGNVAAIGLEARDHIWYPQSHHAKGEKAAMNAPYQYSSLEKLRTTLIDLVFKSGIDPGRIVLVGFSQGAMLATNYILAALDRRDVSSSTEPYLPVPGYIFALAGSLFTTQPPFPQRHFGSEVDEQTFARACQEEEALAEKHGHIACPSQVKLRLLCGANDRFFQPAEIEEAAARLAKAKESSQARDLAQALQISVGIEPGAPHQITGQMMASIVATLDEIVAQD